jgi:hypothetical protein
MQPTEQNQFQDAIRAMHGCEARHVESVAVREMFQNRVAWEGFVEIFDLTGHPKAKRCYAWRYLDGSQWRYTAVLEIPPVDSPQTAVKVAVAAKARATPR